MWPRQFSQSPPSFTWAGKPTASAWPANFPIFISDVGGHTKVLNGETSYAGSYWVSNGAAWIPVNGSVVLSMAQGRPCVAAAAAAPATWAYQTATTVRVTQAGHGMTAANDGNMVFVEFTSGALASSDGHYAFTYVSANTFDITVATTNGASGNCTIDTTATTRTLWSLTVPGGLLGAMGMIEIDLFTQEPSNVNNKSLSVQFDGNVIFLTTNGATASQGRRVNAAFSTSGTDQSVYAHNGNNNHGWFYNGSGGLAIARQ
jgi:hypothetical protein